MSTYNLYESLNANLKKGDITKDEKKELISKATNLDVEGKKAFLLLIIEHYKIEKNELSNSIPYEMEVSEGGTWLNITKLPIKLRRILLKFIRIAANDMNDMNDNNEDDENNMLEN